MEFGHRLLQGTKCSISQSDAAQLLDSVLILCPYWSKKILLAKGSLFCNGYSSCS